MSCRRSINSRHGEEPRETIAQFSANPRSAEDDRNGIERVRQNSGQVMVNGTALVPNIAAVTLMFVMQRSRCVRDACR